MPLWITYWIWGVLGGSVWRLVDVALGIALVRTRADTLGVLYILNLTLGLAYATWVLVGIWRSAGKYRPKGQPPGHHPAVGGGRSGLYGWGVVARVLVVVAVAYGIESNISLML